MEPTKTENETKYYDLRDPEDRESLKREISFRHGSLANYARDRDISYTMLNQTLNGIIKNKNVCQLLAKDGFIDWVPNSRRVA